MKEHRGGPRPNAGRPRLPRLTADEAKALLRELAPDARTPMDYAWAVGCRPERVREALRGGCTVATAERWRWARDASISPEEHERRYLADVAAMLAEDAAAGIAEKDEATNQEHPRRAPRDPSADPANPRAARLDG